MRASAVDIKSDPVFDMRKDKNFLFDGRFWRPMTLVLGLWYDIGCQVGTEF
jgi:hypothetical protein